MFFGNAFLFWTYAIIFRINTFFGKVLDPRALGPWALGPRALGPRPLGPNALGPRALGPRALGPRALGPRALGPRALGPLAVFMIHKRRVYEMCLRFICVYCCVYGVVFML